MKSITIPEQKFAVGRLASFRPFSIIYWPRVCSVGLLQRAKLLVEMAAINYCNSSDSFLLQFAHAFAAFHILCRWVIESHQQVNGDFARLIDGYWIHFVTTRWTALGTT